MSSLAELPDLVGFFSYSRSDDEHSQGALSQLRVRIHNELRLQLGRHLRLWQDTAAIPDGAQWKSEIERAIGESVFFIPIVTPSAVASKHCRFEFESFLKRESALGRDNLVFPLLYVRVPELEDEQQWTHNDVLKIIGTRQYFDWRRNRHRSFADAEVAEKIAQYCSNIVAALRGQRTSPERHQTAKRVQKPGFVQRISHHRGTLAALFGILILTATAIALILSKEPNDEPAWRKVLAQRNSTTCTDFLNRFPSSAHAVDARLCIEKFQKEDEDDWKLIQAGGQAADYAAYLTKWPGGLHAAAARIAKETVEKQLAEDQAWKTVQASPSALKCRAFAAEFSSSKHADDARDCEKRFDDDDWAAAQKGGKPADFEAYLERWPAGSHVESASAAKTKIEARLAEEQAWSAVKANPGPVLCKSFLSRFPSSSHASDAQRCLTDFQDDGDWAIAQQGGRPEHYEAYLKKWPTGRHAAAAQSAGQNAFDQQAARRQQCTSEAQQTFRSTVSRVLSALRSSSPDQSVERYFAAPEPKAFALCTDWQNSTPTNHVGVGHGFSSAISANSQRVVDSYALNECNNARIANGGVSACCSVVQRGNQVELSFPAGWPASCN
jgi:hypothetical protein